MGRKSVAPPWALRWERCGEGRASRQKLTLPHAQYQHGPHQAGRVKQVNSASLPPAPNHPHLLNNELWLSGELIIMSLFPDATQHPVLHP